MGEEGHARNFSSLTPSQAYLGSPNVLKRSRDDDEDSESEDSATQASPRKQRRAVSTYDEDMLDPKVTGLLKTQDA